MKKCIQSVVVALFALGLIAAHAAPANEKEERERDARVKLQFEYALGIAQSLMMESLFRLCANDKIADEVAPTRVQRAEAAVKASRAYAAAGGEVESGEDLERVATILDSTETAWDAGFRLGVTKTLEFHKIPQDKFCSDWLEALTKSLEGAEPAANDAK